MINIFVEIDSKFNIVNEILSLVYIKDNKILLPKRLLKFNNRKREKVFNNLNSVINLYKFDTIIFEKEIKKISNYHSENDKINLGEHLLKIIEYIIEKKKLDTDISIAIMVNNFTGNIKNTIYQLAIKYKHLSIVTDRLNTGLKTQEYINNKYGIILKVSNNKRKALKNAKLILNIDMDSVMLNQYTILDDAILMNLNEKVEIKSKRFSGLNLNKIEFSILKSKKGEIEGKYNINCDKYDVEDFRVKEIRIEKIFSENGFL